MDSEAAITELKQKLVEMEKDRDEHVDMTPRIECVIQSLSRLCDSQARQIRELQKEKLILACELERLGTLLTTKAGEQQP